MTIQLDQFNNINELHEYIANELDVPSYYGRNFDALYDVLSTYCKRLEIHIYGIDNLFGQYRDDVDTLLDMLEYIVDENQNIICFIDDYEM